MRTSWGQIMSVSRRLGSCGGMVGRLPRTRSARTMTERQKPESCPSCGRYTERGKQQLAEQSKARPIYGTDFSRPLSELVEFARTDIARVRGRLSDISFAYPGWGEHLACVEGLLTCGLVTLHKTAEDMRENEKRKATADGVSEDGK